MHPPTPSLSIRPGARAVRAVAVVAALTWASPLLATDSLNWPAFRGHNALGVSASTSLPIEWNGESGEGIAWKVPIPGLGHSSPIVWGDRVYVLTAVRQQGESSLKVGLYGNIAPVNDDSPHSWRLFALDRSTGATIWETELLEAVPKIKRHTKASHANTTPATNGEVIVSMLGSEGLYVHDMQGKLVWKKDLGVLDSGFFQVKGAQWGFASSPVIEGDRIIIQADVQEGSFVAAFDLASGEEVWRTGRNEVPTWSTPSIAPHIDGSQVVLNGWKHIGGYALDSGQELWRLEGGGDIPVPTPIVTDDLLLITSAHGAMRPIYAITHDARGDLGKGEDVDEEAVVWMLPRSGNYMQTPIVIDDLAYFGMDNGVLTVLELATGERVYQHRLGGGSTGFTASPVAGDGKLYFTSEEGDVHVVAHGREFQELAVNELGETFMSTPAISGDLILFRARNHLFAVGAIER